MAKAKRRSGRPPAALEAQQARARQTATAEILRVIAATPTGAQPVFDAIVASAMKLLGGTTAHLTRLEGGSLHLVACRTNAAGAAALQRLYPLAVAGSPVAAVLAKRRALVVGDVESDPRMPEKVRVATRVRGVRSLILVPMVSKGSSIGTIVVNRRTAGDWSEHDVELLRTFADQAVIAIENARLFNETKEALERQTATAEILKVIASSPSDVQPVFDAIAANAVRLSDAQCAVFRYDGSLVHAVALSNVAPDAEAAIRDSYPRPLTSDNATTRAILERSVVHIADVLSDPSYALGGLAQAANYRSILSVPMLRAGTPLGAITVTRVEPGGFAEQQVAVLKAFADQAVIAIENVRLFNETKEALERQTATAEILKVIASSPSDVQPVFDAIAESAKRLLSGQTAVVTRRSGDMLQLAAYTSTGEAGDAALKKVLPAKIVGQGHTGKALLTAAPVLVADVDTDPDYSDAFRANARVRGFRSVVSVPMLREGEPIGVISVYRSFAGKFSDRQIAILQTFADQAVIAIENVRLFNETKEALERQTATAEILKVISGSPTDTGPVFEAIVRHAADLCGGMFANVFRFEGEMLHFLASSSTNREMLELLGRQYPMRPDRSQMSGRTALEKTIVRMTDALGDADYDQRHATLGGWRRMIGVPMMRDGKLLGVFVVGWVEPGPVSARHEELLKTFAAQAVIAIENVRLFKELQSRTEALTKSVGQLTALGEVGQAISSTLELDKVLQTIVERAVALTGLDNGSIYEYDEMQEEFRLQAADSVAPELLEAVRRTPVRKGDGTVGGTAVTREAAQVPDILDGSYRSSRKDVLVAAGYRAILTVPLLHEDRVIGALSVTRKTPGEFAPEVVELLKTFATQSAMAIQNARLFREIEDKGRQLEVASRHKSQFLASMSHELRTPLNAILGFNEMILGEVYGEVPPDMKEPLSDMQASGRHLLRLINNVLDLAKIEAGRMELALSEYSVHDVVENVRATVRPLAESKGLDLGVSVPADLPLAYGDAGRITQCLMNLAGNSLKFTRQGKVAIAVALNDGARLRYSVTDTGIGIAPDKIGSLFTEFKQTDATIASEYGGTGLGLSITKKFIELHGGRIWVESEPGRGSAFMFEVPLRANP